MTLKQILRDAVVIVVAIVGSLFFANHSQVFGAIGGQLVENNIPVIRVNGGYNSALPVKTSSSVTSATSDLTNSTFCVNFYATSTATALHLVASTTGALPGGSAAVITANYGSCAG